MRLLLRKRRRSRGGGSGENKEKYFQPGVEMYKNRVVEKKKERIPCESRDPLFSLLSIMLHYVNRTCMEYTLLLVQRNGRLVEQHVF